MLVYLYKMSSDPNAVNKAISALGTTECRLKEDTSIMAPGFVVSGVAPAVIAKCNYIYVPELGRYYFVNDIVARTGRGFELSCHIDVLMTYKSTILNMTTEVDRQENVYNELLTDPEMPFQRGNVLKQVSIGTVGSGTYWYMTSVGVTS